MVDETRVISLPDGRDLAWFETGRLGDPPVVIFHGSPGSGRDFSAIREPAAGFRLIAPDRPGYGHSSYHPDRTFASWVDDVEHLADHLRLDRFSVVGWSSGGPNAAACARFLAHRLVGCAIVSGPGPPNSGISDRGMQPSSRVGRRLLRAAPVVGRSVMGPLAHRVLRKAHRDPTRALDQMLRKLPPPDVEIIARPDVRAALTIDFARPLSATAGRAAVQDFALEVTDWGFRLQDITMTVHVWHGDQDRNVPVLNGLRQAELVPGGRLHRLADAGHYLIYQNLGSILEELLH